MHSERDTCRIDKLACPDAFVQVGDHLAQKIAIVTIDETHLHALAFLRLRLEAFFLKIGTHGDLRISA